MIDPAVVISISNGVANVRISNQESCDKCGLCSAGKKQFELEVDDTLGVIPGDRILLEIKPKDIIVLSFLIYILPLIATFVGYFILFFLTGKREGPGIIGAFAGFFLSFFFILIARKKKTKQFEIKMIEKLNL